MPVSGRRARSRTAVAAGRRGAGRNRRIPARPRLGSRLDHQRHPRGRIPLRCGGIRCGLLRDLAAGGAGDGSAAAVAAGDLVGGGGAFRNRPWIVARQPDRRVRRGHVPRLRVTSSRDPGGGPGLSGHGQLGQHRLRQARLHPGAGGARRHHRHGVFVIAGRPAPGLPGIAPIGVFGRAGRRRDGDGEPGPVRRLQPAAGPRPGWPL